MGDGSSSDGEGWLQRIEADQVSDAQEDRIADGIGHQVWPAAFLLTSYIEARHAAAPGYWQGKRVLELGGGSGLVGLLCAALGAHVVITDLPSVLELLRSNAADNAEAIGRAGGCVDVTELTWGQPELPHGWNAPDFVLAADLVYNRHLYEPLLKTLQQFGSNTTILVANVRRWKHGESLFFKPAKRVFSLVDLMPSIALDKSVLHNMQSSNRLRLYQFRRNFVIQL